MQRLYLFVGGLTSLGDADDIVTRSNGRKAILLDRSRNFVATKIDILDHGRMKASVLESSHRNGANWTLLLELDLDQPIYASRNM